MQSKVYNAYNIMQFIEYNTKQGLRQDSEAATTKNGTNCTRTGIFQWPSFLLADLTLQFSFST